MGKTVPCPACGAETEQGVSRCPSCGRRRRRGSSVLTETPFSTVTTEHNRPALRAYRLSVVSVLPGVGLVAGPLAVILGLRARLRGRRDPLFTARGPAVAAVILGALTAVTNWVGFTLMFIGLRHSGWL
jgi:hypothetical protein